MTDEDILAEQIAYYRARAGEYDQWFRRQGRYDRGAELNARWHAEAGQVRQALDRFAPAGRVLELACGTGLWTARLVAERLARLGWDATVERTAEYFLYGFARRAADRARPDQPR